MTETRTTERLEDTRLVPCERCGSEGRIYVSAGRWEDGSPREEDLGECSECNGTGRALIVAEPVEMEDLTDER